MTCLAADRLNKGGLMGDSLTGEGKRGKAGKDPAKDTPQETAWD